MKVVKGTQSDRRAALLISAFGAFVAGLCCLTPIVLVALGVTSVGIANNWGNLLYGEYKWWFRLAALAALSFTLWLYLQSRGICTLNELHRQRNRVINLILLVLLTSGGLYLAYNYVALHYLGIASGLPWAQWDESWAIAPAAALLGVSVLAFWALPRLSARQSQTLSNTSPAGARPLDRDCKTGAS